MIYGGEIMGLDMYLYKVKKVDKKRAKELEGLNEETIYDTYNNIAVTHIPGSEDDKEEFNKMYNDILPYFTKIHILCDYINEEQIRKDNEIPDDWYSGGYSCSQKESEYYFVSPNSDDEKIIRIPVSTLEEKYVITKNEEVYVVEREEVGYWRKQYDLQDLLYEDYEREIYNCGYHRVNEDMFDDIMAYKEVDYGGLNREIKTDDVLFYHEWY